ncbi:hypothetical protein Bca52824_001789 [Brassica carinata]|uniref:Uncharacterized protein n=1 Tax=Brassica carinata TaxID=52824 RepID=A0A8X8BA17_BRACI|nr:hypothetical protein Bca52824_001789 [Brassica carinata]
MSVTVPNTPTPSVAATSDSILALATTNKPNDQITNAEDNSRLDAKQGNTISNSHTSLVSSKETPSSSNHVSTNSAPADCSIRRNLSSYNLLTNRFRSLESSDDEHVDELDTKEYFSPSGKVFLRERPAIPSTKAKEMQLHP